MSAAVCIRNLPPPFDQALILHSMDYPDLSRRPALIARITGSQPTEEADYGSLGRHCLLC
jgi:hypothetical protein